MKTKETMIPGKRYRGYGFINEYKEFCFEPEETGAHAGREKSICVRQGVRVSQTKNLVIVKFNVEREEKKLNYIKKLATIYNVITQIFKEYEI